ncbi:HET-domain-containing protein [Lentithecium fluviatile CBS 122367]|uniref:HET-domain-containing protein n=1 Tax=Lentithecium fluviatile CBS 122367 TaxID=1168545 RepID=A0A6G1IYV0_9PLEO|nr:HET-domain-containing protein [Lentithecium fluviatile CBS 122367]
MTVTKQLEYTYLWIDRYCIDQTSDQEKHTQARQMDKIYASVQTTIIASAGDDTNYCVPDISRPRRRNHTPRKHRLGSFDLVDAKFEAATGKRHMEDIAEDYETPVIAEFEGFLPMSDNSTLDINHAEKFMQAYSSSQLTYDEDDLNATTGILNHLSNHAQFPNGVFHIRGLLFRFLRDCAKHVVHLSLNWYYWIPGRWRHGFPSWPSLGCEGPKLYFFHQPRVPFDLDIRVRGGTQSWTFRDYLLTVLATHNSGLLIAPSQLEITRGLAFPLELKRVGGDTRVAFQLARDMSTCYTTVYWDEGAAPSDRNTSCLELVTEWQTVIILFAKDGQELYERVGIFILGYLDVTILIDMKNLNGDNGRSFMPSYYHYFDHRDKNCHWESSQYYHLLALRCQFRSDITPKDDDIEERP